jgi:hypothetical protein
MDPTSSGKNHIPFVSCSPCVLDDTAKSVIFYEPFGHSFRIYTAVRLSGVFTACSTVTELLGGIHNARRKPSRLGH